VSLDYIDGMGDECTGTVSDLALWGWTTTANSIQSGRFGGGCMRLQNRTATRSYAANARMTCGFAWRTDNAANITQGLMEFRDTAGGVEHVRLTYNGNGTFTVSRAGTALAGGTTAVLSVLANVWYYLELDVTIDDATGAFNLRFQGTSVCSNTGVDTRNGGNASTDNILLQHGASGAGDFDDLYLASGATSFQGDTRVITGLPTGDGGTVQWTPSTGVNHWAVVDENPENGDTDYVSDATGGDRDLYTYPALGVTGTVIAVQTGAVARKDDAGARNLALVVKSGATTSDGTTQALAASYGGYTRIDTVDPNTAAAWTVANVNAAQFGVKDV